MKQLITVLFICIFNMICAQVPFVEYQVVPNYTFNTNGQIVPMSNTNPFGSTLQTKKNVNNNYTIIGAYYIDLNNRLKRIKIQVNSTSYLSIQSVFLRGVYNNDYNSWSVCNTLASKIDPYMDGEYLANNFEWKVNNATYGTIYFNY